MTRSKIKAFLEKSAFTSAFFVNVLAALVLLYFYTLAFSRLLPEGINQVFTNRLNLRVSLLVAVMSLVVIYSRRFIPSGPKAPDAASKFGRRDLLLLLLPMTPVARYIILNLGILPLLQILALVLVFLALGLVLSFLVPLALRFTGSARILSMTGLAFSFVLYSMASLAADLKWHGFGSLFTQLAALAVVLTVLLVLDSVDRRFLRMAVSLFFAVGIATALAAAERETSLRPRPLIAEMLESRPPTIRPDIFLLVYDSYLGNETMLAHGIDNSMQEAFLVGKGFRLYRGIWSVGRSTIASMGAMLGISRSIASGREATSGNGTVQCILRDSGYETQGVFSTDYLLRGVEPSYDRCFPAPSQVTPSHILLARQILEGEFRFDAGFDQIAYADYLSEKRQALAAKGDRPVFLYAHSTLPGHSQKSGRCLGNEVNVYLKGLAMANEEMREDIETVVRQNPDALVIVCGDHGPYLTKTCYSSPCNDYTLGEIDRLDIQDRHGAFLAIRWPEHARVDHDSIGILQDVFPAVFAWMYDEPFALGARIERLTGGDDMCGARVKDGIIEGGMDDGEPLFESSTTPPAVPSAD